jgi:hypothetical protein
MSEFIAGLGSAAAWPIDCRGARQVHALVPPVLSAESSCGPKLSWRLHDAFLAPSG